jgi:RNA polymerase sigma factor (sigma-70 family)
MKASVYDERLPHCELPAACAECLPHKIDIAALFRQHHDNLVKFVRRYVRSNEDAEDVVQNAFLEAIRCADNFAGLSKPSTWLFGIALNLARNQVRRNCNYLCDSVEDDVLEHFADGGPDPSDITERLELVSMVRNLLGDLPPDLRDTFSAVLGDECTYRQAAAKLEIPVGTVRSRVSRVRTAIRKRLIPA